jgi:hypothetical protein
MSRSARITSRRLASCIQVNPSAGLIQKVNAMRQKVSLSRLLVWIAAERRRAHG